MTEAEGRLPPIHPGEILREDLMIPYGISASRLARDLRVPVTRITDILHGRRSITADTALRPGRYFGNDARFWLNLQTAYDLEVAERRATVDIEREVLPRPAA